MFWLSLIGIFGAALGLAYFYGKEVRKAETSQDFTDTAIKSMETEEVVADLSDDELDDELWPDDDKRV